MPAWLVNLIRNTEALFGFLHPYINFYFMQQTVIGFCWVVATQWYNKMGSPILYRKSYLRYLCESQAYVEYDKVWTCQNSENKTNIGCPDPDITVEDNSRQLDTTRLSSFFSENPDEFMNKSRRVRSKNFENFTDLFWGSKKAKEK